LLPPCAMACFSIPIIAFLIANFIDFQNGI
jgi:hypothetical protein